MAPRVALTRESCKYTSLYCEENVWQLAQDTRLPLGQKHAVFITNENRKAALWCQRVSPDKPVVWDYHVVLLVEAAAGPVIFDLDSTLPFPSKLGVYLRKTFHDQSNVVEEYRAKLRVIDSKSFLESFCSDRAHMRNADGSWKAPPPAWPEIKAKARPWPLFDVLDLSKRDFGRIVTVDALAESFAK
jgi:protein N-terminal glutamine amidohydrolase